MCAKYAHYAIQNNECLLQNSLFYVMFNYVQVLNILGDKFGTETNEKGYKMLPKYLRVIQGDGISYETLDKILKNMKKNKWSAENLVLGSGGALLQKLDRDTQKCAYKCSFAVIDDKEV